MIDDPGCTAGSLISSIPCADPSPSGEGRWRFAEVDREHAKLRAEARHVAHALHQLNAIGADAQTESGHCCEMRDHQRWILLLDRHPGADRAAANPEIAQIVGRLSDPFDAAGKRSGVGREFLSETNRHCVLQMRAPGFDDVVELHALRRQRSA